MYKVRTKRLTIRPLERTDFKAWKKAQSSEGAAKNSWDIRNFGKPDTTYKTFLKILKYEKSLRENDQSYIFGIFINATGGYLGNIDILNVMRGCFQTALLGIDLFNAHWGIGIGREVGQALPRLIFQELGLHRVEGNIESKNTRSVNLAKAVGLRREGFKRKAAMIRGEWVGLTLYAATAEDFGFKWKRKGIT